MTPLEEKITQANIAYWSKHKPITSDAEYDKLIEQLRKEDPFNPLITKLDDGTKNECVHPYPMLSLRKVYNVEDLKSWVRSVARSEDEKFSCSLKLDGCTCRITEGNLYTRGDGHAGENITPVRLIVKGITRPNDLGEIVITHRDFTDYFVSGQIFCKDGSYYQNQRNAVAGLLGRVGDIYKLPPVLTFVSYSDACPMQFFTMKELESVKIDDLINWALSFDYPIDGLVFKLVDLEYSESLGNTAHHPRGQMAYKFENCSKETEIVDIAWQLGRTGVLTPVVKVKPIEIQGSTITSVTAHDAKHVKDLQICIGHKAKVSKAGMVIPFLESVWPTMESRHSRPVLPEFCPVCGKKLTWTSTGVDLVCSNMNCSDKLIKGLTYSCKVLGMDGWADETLKELMLKYKLNLLYIFKMTLDSLQQVFPGKRSVNLFNVKEEMLKRLTPELLLAALGIPLIGKENSREVLSMITLNDIANGHVDGLPLSQVKMNIQIWSIKKENPVMLKMILDYLTERGIELKMPEPVPANSKTICFTGKMDLPRSEMEEEGRRRGYEPSSSVTKGLSLLVASDLNDTSSKMKKAKDYGVEIMSVHDFMDIPYI